MSPLAGFQSPISKWRRREAAREGREEEREKEREGFGRGRGERGRMGWGCMSPHRAHPQLWREIDAHG